jgi:hypothetical protein
LNQKLSRMGFIAAAGLCGAVAHGQVADLLSTYDAGSKSIGLGSSLTATDAETLSAYNNPAGLGYINHQEIDAAYGNLPRSHSNVGDLNGTRTYTSTQTGPASITNLGFAFPVSKKANSGTIGISYSLGGYVDDSGSASQVPYGTSTTEVAGNYLDHIESKTNYLAIGYGKTNPSQTLSFGASILWARESIQYRQEYGVFDTSGSSPVLLSTQDTGNISGTSNGIGVVAGLDYIPSNLPNLTLGASLKSPIKLTGGDGVDSYYSTIPGRLLVGGGLRLSGLKNRKDDYTVIGAQFEQFYGGSGTGLLSVQNSSAGDFGAEYGFTQDDFVIPIRVGYRAISSEGPAFADRNELTYGFGIKDKESRYGIDLSWARPRHAAGNFTISASYRFVNP